MPGVGLPLLKGGEITGDDCAVVSTQANCIDCRLTAWAVSVQHGKEKPEGVMVTARRVIDEPLNYRVLEADASLAAILIDDDPAMERLLE
jgi:hypothetical protein